MSDCQKIRFPSRRAAKAFVKQKPFLTRVYRCFHCDGAWHATSADGETTRMFREYRQRMTHWKEEQ